MVLDRRLFTAMSYPTEAPAAIADARARAGHPPRADGAAS